MDFLKSILGDDLYSQVESKINAYNSDEANKDNQIKIANLTSGEYISKNKFTDLETEKGNIATQLTAANKLIEDLKKSGKVMYTTNAVESINSSFRKVTNGIQPLTVKQGHHISVLTKSGENLTSLFLTVLCIRVTQAAERQKL